MHMDYGHRVVVNPRSGRIPIFLFCFVVVAAAHKLLRTNDVGIWWETEADEFVRYKSVMRDASWIIIITRTAHAHANEPTSRIKQWVGMMNDASRVYEPMISYFFPCSVLSNKTNRNICVYLPWTDMSREKTHTYNYMHKHTAICDILVIAHCYCIILAMPCQLL